MRRAHRRSLLAVATVVLANAACEHRKPVDWSQAAHRVSGPMDTRLLECAVVDGNVGCRGWNTQGVLGRGTFDESMTTARHPLDWSRVDGVSGVTDIAMTRDATTMCAVSAEGLVSCWGSNTWGQLGQGWLPATEEVHDASRARAQPVVVSGLPKIDAIAGGAMRFCAVDHDRHVWCWGSNQAHAIAADSTTRIARPVRIEGIPAAAKIIAGDLQVCVVGVDTSFWCWGAADTRSGSPSLLTTPTRLFQSGIKDGDSEPTSHEPMMCAIPATGERICWNTFPPELR